jgi:hypothetical protein
MLIWVFSLKNGYFTILGKPIADMKKNLAATIKRW